MRKRGLPRLGAAVAMIGSAVFVGLSTPSEAATTPTPVSAASTSARGVSTSTINVVFPLISFSSVEGNSRSNPTPNMESKSKRSISS